MTLSQRPWPRPDRPRPGAQPHLHPPLDHALCMQIFAAGNTERDTRSLTHNPPRKAVVGSLSSDRPNGPRRRPSRQGRITGPRVPQINNRRVVVAGVDRGHPRGDVSHRIHAPVKVLTHACQGHNQVPTLHSCEGGDGRQDRPCGQPGHVGWVPPPCALSMTYQEQETTARGRQCLIPGNRTGSHEGVAHWRRPHSREPDHVLKKSSRMGKKHCGQPQGLTPPFQLLIAWINEADRARGATGTPGAAMPRSGQNGRKSHNSPSLEKAAAAEMG